MAVSVLDFTTMLAPISAEERTGHDLRLQEFSKSLYHTIKDARVAARNLERQQIQGAEAGVQPDWASVQNLAIQALATQTKDIEIIAWLIEALLREQGFSGLRDGFKLAREIIASYWDVLHPMPDEDGLITRLAPLTGLNGEASEGTLIAAIALVPLTQGRSCGPFALWQYQQAVEILKIVDPNKRKQRLAAGVITLEIIQQAVLETSLEFIQEQLKNLNECINEFNALNELLKEKAGDDAPPSSRILAQLNACLECIKIISKGLIINSAVDSNSAVGITENSAVKNSTNDANLSLLNLSTINNDAILNREQVLQLISSAADFFRRTEPHSPVSYLLERAVHWSKKPLPELLKELIKDETALGHFCNLTGVNIES